MKRKPLEGIRVIDFTWALSGPISTKHLSDLGAEVIKIETRVRLDIQRTGSKFGSFNQHNTGKLAITINLKKPRGLELMRQLIAHSDIVVENFAGGSMHKMGLGYEFLKGLKPDIIMLSSCMQGQTGPFATHPGIGFRLTALSGFNHITGWPDRQPGWIGAYTDFVAPRYIIAIMAALEYRRRTGKGQYLDMSQFESGVQFMAPLILDHSVNKQPTDRMGNECTYAAPHNAYRCLGEDRWCAISVFTDEEWESFCGVIDNPGLAKDPMFATIPARKKNEEKLDKLVTEWTNSRSPEEVMNAMQTAGVPAGVVQTGEDLMDHDPQLKYRHYFTELDHPEVGKYRTNSGAHFRLSKYEDELVRAPLLGEHNEYVFKKILGVPDDEYDKLVEEEVIN
jgi:benzylsuccinate CoA-transferase BbsF subunit